MFVYITEDFLIELHGRRAGRLRSVLAETLTVGRLFETIRVLVAQEQYVVGQHAAERLDERGILEWQVVDGLAAGSLIEERPNDLPNPSVVVRQLLADGTEVKAVWSHLVSVDVAKLVTVHFFDELT